jgi:phenylalanyl-tRNA synthetase alpha chain
MSKNIVINDPNEGILIKELAGRIDIKAERIKRLLGLSDLTKKENSPVKILVDQILKLPRFSDFALVDFPRVVTVQDNFDLLNTPKDHPSRRETDTYYLTDKDILRTQTTTMWPFCLRDKGILETLEKDGHFGALSTGIVFRKDEIDRNHFPAFHQVDGLYICRKGQKVITQNDLEEVEIDIAKSIFGDDVEYKFLVDTFPFTDPSVEMDIKFNNDWLEVVGSGLVHTEVLKKFGLDPEIYNGWAFGFGLERLAMVKMGINDIRVFWSNDERITSQFKDINSKFKEVSKYPETSRDISFIIDKSVNLNNYYEIVRDFVPPQRDPAEGGTEVPLIEEVKLVDEFENDEKFGADKKSYTFRIVYRSPERTLTAEEVNEIQEKIREKTKQDLSAVLR